MSWLNNAFYNKTCTAQPKNLWRFLFEQPLQESTPFLSTRGGH
jgi:hypothetical protein